MSSLPRSHLFDLALSLARAYQRRGIACLHRCACGAELTCGASLQDQDRCPIGDRPWTCQACELDALDSFFNSTPAHDEQETR